MLRKKTLLFFVVLVLAFLLMTYQSKKGRILPGFSINNILNSSHAAIQSLADAIKSPLERMAVREEENRRLKKRLDELLIERRKYQEAVIEDDRLKELLKLREKQQNAITAARVIARGVDYWAKTLTLDKGLKDGVAKDMSAVTPKGLAGKITDVSASYCRLLLLTDINFSAAARLQGSRKEGIISGAGTKKCILKYVPYEEEIKTGDIVITSGLDQLFPAGIAVGYVSTVERKGRGGNFQYIEVTPFQDDAKMEEVLIVK
jgi:rod shape-determining protein MreC